MIKSVPFSFKYKYVLKYFSKLPFYEVSEIIQIQHAQE
jgi:hypothetical protein